MAFINVDKYIKSSDGLGLDDYGINQLRAIEWSRKYLWSFNFIEVAERADSIKGPQAPPAPFDTFFPCVDIDETRAILNTFSAEAYGGGFKLPQRGDVSTLRITFIDDQKNTLYNFFKNWIEIDILNNGKYITPLEEAVKAVELKKVKLATLKELASGAASLAGLAEQKNNTISDSSKYWVFPEGAITYNGGSTSDVNTYSVDLVIVGTFSEGLADGGVQDTLKNLVKSFGSSAILGGVGKILGR